MVWDGIRLDAMGGMRLDWMGNNGMDTVGWVGVEWDCFWRIHWISMGRAALVQCSFESFYLLLTTYYRLFTTSILLARVRLLPTSCFLLLVNHV